MFDFRNSQPATVARERLLRAIEITHPLPPPTASPRLPVPPISATFPAFPARPEHPAPVFTLSPAEQEAQAVQVAHTFKQHYLSDITYVENRRLAVAIIKPAAVRPGSDNAPLRIYVDPNGNISISLDDSPSPPSFRMVGQALISGTMLILLTIVLLAFLL